MKINRQTAAQCYYATKALAEQKSIITDIFILPKFHITTIAKAPHHHISIIAASNFITECDVTGQIHIIGYCLQSED